MQMIDYILWGAVAFCVGYLVVGAMIAGLNILAHLWLARYLMNLKKRIEEKYDDAD